MQSTPGLGQFRLALALLIASFAWQVSTPRASSACFCCACDFGGGNIQCGNGDADCGLCIALGGTPAPTCDVCSSDSECDGETRCAGDPDMCVPAVSGGCCTFFGCFLLTQPGCEAAQGGYRGNGSDCSAPCESNGAPCTTPTDCQSTFCVDGFCCDTPCDGPTESCSLSGHVGICTASTAPAPVLTTSALLLTAGLLGGFGAFALRRRRNRS